MFPLGSTPSSCSRSPIRSRPSWGSRTTRWPHRRSAQTTLRSLLGRADLDTLLAHREGLNDDLRSIIEKQTEPWGVEVRVVEIKDVEIPESMQRAMAREAEAERERRAKVINARGELQASDELRQAAETLSKTPASLQLRYLQTLLELGADQNSTVVFPLPVDIITPFLQGTRYPGEHRRDPQWRNNQEPRTPSRLTPFPWHHLSPLTSHLSPLTSHRERACLHLDTPRYRDTLRTLAERCPNSQASVLWRSRQQCPLTPPRSHAPSSVGQQI